MEQAVGRKVEGTWVYETTIRLLCLRSLGWRELWDYNRMGGRFDAFRILRRDDGPYEGDIKIRVDSDRPR
jgi:hypothetical protein